MSGSSIFTERTPLVSGQIFYNQSTRKLVFVGCACSCTLVTSKRFVWMSALQVDFCMRYNKRWCHGGERGAKSDVCSSVTLSYCTASVMISSPTDSPKINFCRCQVNPKIRKVSPRATVLKRLRWVWIDDFQPFSHRISETVQNNTKVLLTNNRKLHTRFRLVPKSTTLVDLELTSNEHCALYSVTSNARLWSPPQKKIFMKIYRYL